MPANHQLKHCVSRVQGALVFWSPDAAQRRSGARVQIIDLASLQLVSGYTRDPQGRLLLEAQPSLAAGRSWTLQRAVQMIRCDARPHRWVALQQDRRAWGLFWAGGGLQHCRSLLAAGSNGSRPPLALVPATPETLLNVVLDRTIDHDTDLEPPPAAAPPVPWRLRQPERTWRIILWTSAVWMAVLAATVAGLLSTLERQDRKLELLLQRTAPQTALDGDSARWPSRTADAAPAAAP